MTSFTDRPLYPSTNLVEGWIGASRDSCGRIAAQFMVVTIRSACPVLLSTSCADVSEAVHTVRCQI
jgi:hypothetical protein